MKLIKCKLRNSLGDITKDLPVVVNEILAQYEALKTISSVCVAEDKYIQSHPDFDDDFTDYRFDIFEDFLNTPPLTATKYMSSMLCCATPALDRRLKDFLNTKEEFDKLIQEYTLRYIPLSEDELEQLQKLLKDVFGNLLYVLYYQFEVIQTADDYLAENPNPSIESNIYQYLNANGIDAKSFALEVRALLSKYSPRMPIFDKYPDLEDDFYDLVGPYVKDFETLSDIITENEVLTVLKGGANFDIEGYIKELESSIKTATEVKKLNVF